MTLPFRLGIDYWNNGLVQFPSAIGEGIGNSIMVLGNYLKISELASFSEEAKRRYREEHWEADLQRAFDAGRRMGSK